MSSKTLFVIPLLENCQPNLESTKDFLNCFSVSLKHTFKEKNFFLERSIVTKIKYPQSAFCTKRLVVFLACFREKTRSFSKNYFRCQSLKLNHLSAFRKNDPVVFCLIREHTRRFSKFRESPAVLHRAKGFSG